MHNRIAFSMPATNTNRRPQVSVLGSADPGTPAFEMAA